MLIRFAFLLFLPFQYLMGSIIGNEEELCFDAPVPSWVVPTDFPLSAETRGSHLQFLLIEFQENWPEHAEYRHMVIKALTQTGVEAIAQLDIGFEPSFQKLFIHDIRVYRDGVWIDKKNSRHELLQREEELEDNLVSGELTMVYFLEDIRPGDIIEYAYSTIGANPLFASHYFDRMAFQISFNIEKISHRLLTYQDHFFAIKPHNVSIEPTIKDWSDTLREWRWEVVQPEVYVEEESEPEWYHPEVFIELSDYRNWEEVAKDIAPLFSLPEDFDSYIPTEMANMISTWDGSQADRALAALRFVQDEVRYLGFEEGVMGHKPHDPRLVFQQRFGDCKDKTFLLKALLHLMGVSSTPVLVDTRAGKLIPDMLPNPNAFNHIILQVTIDGVDYWVDPTISLQGGSLDDNVFPNYYWGLPLTKEGSALMALPLYDLKKPTEIEAQFKVISETKAELAIVWTAFGAKADAYRQYVQQVGLLNLSEESLNALQKKHGNATIKFPMSVNDDRCNNIFTLKESYVFPLRNRGGKTILKVSSITVKHFLDADFNPNRTAPYALTYPLWIKEHIHVDNPFANWKNAEEEINFDFDFAHYRLLSKTDSQTVDLFHELKHCNDYVPVDEVREYWEAVKEVEPYGFLDFKIK